ncbi:MAG: LD-carboxypeptidase [Nocardioides sp.]
MRPDLRLPPKLTRGDRVAVLSPSSAAPAQFPGVHDLALRRLREDFDLEPVEYPTTRQWGATPQARADDIMAAFADPQIKALLATIGGDDQISVLPYLDPHVVIENPKTFVGYSDNTNLLNWCWQLGLAGYHGGSTMVHVGRAGGVHPVFATSLRAALMDGGTLTLGPVDTFSEDEVDWSDPAALEVPAPVQPSPAWVWHRPDEVVTGPTWGGHLGTLHHNLAASRWIRPDEDYDGCVLILETSEELPHADDVFAMLRDIGERGLLARFPAVVFALPKAAHFGRPADLLVRQRYRHDQCEAVVRAFETYSPRSMVVFGVDVGHTDPQWVIPYGGLLTIDGPARKIVAHYA